MRSSPLLKLLWPIYTLEELLDLHIPDLSHPTPACSKVEMLFMQLKAAGYEFNEKCQAMMLLAKLPLIGIADTLASRLRSYHSIVGVENLVFQIIRTQYINIQSIVCRSECNYQ